MGNVENIVKDKDILLELKEKEEILWGEVVRVGQTPEKRAYMLLNTDAKNCAKNYPCIIYREEADAEFKRGSLVYLLGHKIPYVIIKVDEEKARLEGSRKIAQEKSKLAMLQDLATGKEFTGRILNFVAFGAYVEVNGVVGLLKNTDYSIDFSEVSESKKEGDTVQVKCKEVTNEGKIFWIAPVKQHRRVPIDYDFEPGTAVVGTIQDIRAFHDGVGVFVRIAPGLDALCFAPNDLEIEIGVKVSIRIQSVDGAKEKYMPPRVKGRILRVI